MKTRSRSIRASLFLGSLLLFACAGASNPLDGTSWQLDQYRDKGGELVPVIADSVVTALFQAEVASGISGCNSYTTTYQVSGDKLAFGPAASTRKACLVPIGLMAQEDAYLTALSQVQAFERSGDTLEMQDSDGETVLVFGPAGP